MPPPLLAGDRIAGSDQETPRAPHRRWVWIGRAIWVTSTAVVLTFLVAGVRPRYDQIRTLSGTGVPDSWTPPSLIAALTGLGLDVTFFARYTLLIAVLYTVGYAVLAGIIFWRKSDDWLPLLVSLTCLAFGLTVSAVGDGLIARSRGWWWTQEALQALGTGLGLVLFYLLPNGHFVPRWTRPLAAIWLGLMLLWLMVPAAPLNVINVSAAGGTTLAMFIFGLAWFGSGVWAQIARYRRVTDAVVRQQTKWIAIGFVGAFLGGVVRFLPAAVPWPAGTERWRLLVELVGLPIAAVLSLLLPATIAVALLRYRLWDVDAVIGQTLVYGALTAALAVAYGGSIIIFQAAIDLRAGAPPSLAVAGSTLLMALLFLPLRRRLQNAVDRRFHRERNDTRAAFTSFSRDLRTIIDLPALRRVLVDRVTDVLPITHGALFLRQADGTLTLAEAAQVPPALWAPPALDDETLRQLQTGIGLSRPRDPAFPLILPLTAPRAAGTDLIGVLALGPRRSGQPYSRDDFAVLMAFADQAGAAIAVAQLIAVERELDAHRRSPVGRAETIAQRLIDRPQAAIDELSHLSAIAAAEADAAAVLAALPQALRATGADDLARLTESHAYLVGSRSAPEMLRVGLRTLVEELAAPSGPAGSGGNALLAAARTCLAAIDAASIAEIAQCLPQLLEASSATIAAPPSPSWARALGGLCPVAETLQAAERMDDPADRQAYLAQAGTHLAALTQRISEEMAPLVQIVVVGVIDRWTVVVAEAQATLRGQAHLTARLITRHVLDAAEQVLAVELTNLGRVPATQLTLELLPGAPFAAIGSSPEVAVVPPGESVHLRWMVRRRRAGLRGAFGVRFRIGYQDVGGPEQVQVLAETVHVVPVPATWAPIPNPYAPGAALRPGSAVFVGREDVFAFLRTALTADAGPQAVVLTGQRRMGKTSLVHQLPGRLGPRWVPVMLDAQALAIDPGLPGFVDDIAREIAGALDLPPPEDLGARPAATFARVFLPRAREAAGERRLVLVIDEFEELEVRVERGKLPPDLFSYLRHLMQHEAGVAFLFVGTHRLDELNPARWAAFFNVALHRRIGPLDAAAARTLMTAPVAGRLVYDDLAIDKLLRLTAGHPYFVQVLCHILVEEANRERRAYVAHPHVDAAVDRALELGEAHLVDLWTQATPPERGVLTAMADLVSDYGEVTARQVGQCLAERSTVPDGAMVAEALARLARRDLLQTVPVASGAEEPRYRWRLGLVGHWIAHNRGLTLAAESISGRSGA